ncbi:hypothetical protein GUITHDRAFT_140287 [Guillardia theta CCMP2712]|uniref:NAD-dependent epimerase/dehydratase domain-containing protein n=1 Tax=Guillardia theta (strain CCMP2712) TaxID=905079 RepID=L1J5Q6_GUITC|nr:hypothetical protein GUITHDRAFT_140287 [Guillardia theta CCMP2712]EKX43863.1 hypothetical protein GUITHDRAFT_140287 [Guillardia theta CCMP2712]|eukprot:XP_005830843.1 hypothetical protein GUITHDRAFT_140287 [Guillardia theta CCMP2712]
MAFGLMQGVGMTRGSGSLASSTSSSRCLNMQLGGAMEDSRVFIFGLGYVGQALAKHLQQRWGCQVSGTSRSGREAERLSSLGIRTFLFSGGEEPLALCEEGQGRLREATHVLSTIPPSSNGDPVLVEHCETLRSLRSSWVGFLSTCGVYGDHEGEWVDEESATRVGQEDRAAQWLQAEERWRACTGGGGNVFRLAGIYGTGRSAIDSVRSGRAAREDEDKLVSRIHVEDICSVLRVSMESNSQARVFNVADDYPCSRSEVYNFVRHLLEQEGVEVPDAAAAAAVTDVGKKGRRARRGSKKASSLLIRATVRGLRLSWKS